MWNSNTNNENAIIKSLVERLEKVEKKLNEISTVVKEPKSEFKYLDVFNASKFLGLSRAKLYILMRDGAIPYTYVGRQRRLVMADLVKYVEKNYKQAKKSIL
jgi:excisionase family DNA binding protein